MLSTEQLSHQYTLEEYLNCRDVTHDRLYELENGQIQEMPPESWQNLQIVMYLITEITKIIPYQQVTNKAEIIISGSRVTARVPDLTILTPEGSAELAKYERSTITLDMPPPLLVVEVVSPGKKNRDRDYRYKRSEYAARGVANYWIIDPQARKFICLELIDGLYEETVFDNSRTGISLTLPFELEVKFESIFWE
ncbi:MAG: Uma2 family endonuclease [Pleurocapsa sp.]